jgi:tRNA(adenine34) deaminase
MSDLYWMKQAFHLASTAKERGEVPVGAILISAHNEPLGRGENQVISKSDPTAHAEMVALRDAAINIKNFRLDNTTLYVTLEPCCMCAGALVHARIKRLVFATRDFKAGAAGSVFNVLRGYPLNHQVHIDEGVLQHDCSQLLVDFFKDRR